MHVMVMMVVVMMMVVMMVHGSRGSGSWRGRILRHCVAGEAERENGRGGKGLDHDKDNPVVRDPNGSRRTVETCA